MKITCQACQAKYTIADEKVVGKIVKIRCKKCGATIVVNGNESGAGAGSSSPPADPAAKAASASEPWTVNVDEGDQRTMTDAEVVAAYRAGVISDETFCWKEGMSDWLAISEIADLHAACTSGVVRAPSREEDDGPTRVQDASEALAGAMAVPAPNPRRPKSIPPAKDGNGAAAVAARRAGGRAPDNDLFGAAAQAGGEDEVVSSLPGEKMTGARNENSVLFALDPHADKNTAAPAKMPATNEASGLIDIRQLSAQMRSSPPDDRKKKERVDDIMNLGGGAFSPTLAAPVLAAPSLEHISTPPPPGMLTSAGGGQAKNRAIVFLALGAGTFFLVAAVGLVMLLWRGKTPEDHDRATMAAGEGTASASASGAGAKGAPSASASAGGAPTEAASAAAPEAASASAASAKEGAPKEPGAKEPAAHEHENAAPHEEHVAAPKPAYAAPAAAAPAAAAAEPFNMGEARARLAAIAGAVQSCKRGEATGSGRVEIVFAPSGGVQSASLIPGSPFDGSVTAKCVEARFRGAHVPAFSGGPFPVTKSFTIN